MMGRLRAKTNRAGLSVNAVQLGEPVILDVNADPLAPGDTIAEAWFIWDDDAFGTGVVNADGTVTAD